MSDMGHGHTGPCMSGCTCDFARAMRASGAYSFEDRREPAYTPRAEYTCSESMTHYQGCQCHEARWKKRLDRAESVLKELTELSGLAQDYFKQKENENE